MSRRALWATAGVLGAALAALLAAGALLDDSRGGERREAVSRYIAAVNTIQGEATTELDLVNRAYERLGAAPDRRAHVAELERAELTIRGLRERIAALAPPEEAAGLHAQLLELVGLQAGFAREVTELGRYLPRLAAEEAKLADASRRLRSELQRAGTSRAQQRAFGRYAKRLAAVERGLERLSPPPALEPAQRSDVARVRRLGSLAERLRRALADGRAGAVGPLFERLARATADSGPTRAEREAVLAFNGRLEEIREHQAAVERERIRLDRELA